MTPDKSNNGEQQSKQKKSTVPVYEISSSETDNGLPAIGIGTPDDVEFLHAELLTCCRDCDLAQHWSTDRYSPKTPFGESLGSMHHAETEHAIVELSFSGEVDRERYPTVMDALDTESSREDLPESIDRKALFDEMRELYKKGYNNVE